MRILILGSPKVDSTRKLYAECENQGHSVWVLSPHDFICEISNNPAHPDQLTFFDAQTKTRYGIESDTFDAVINRIAGSSLNVGLAITKELEKMGVVVLNSSQSIENCSDKFLTHQLLGKRGLPTPKTLLTSHASYETIVRQLRVPFLVKKRRSSQGKGVFKVDNINKARRFFGKNTDQFLFQEYLDNSENGYSSDIRVMVVGDDWTDQKVVASYKRISQKGDFKSNFSISKNGELVQLTEEEEQMAIHASKAEQA